MVLCDQRLRDGVCIYAHVLTGRAKDALVLAEVPDEGFQLRQESGVSGSIGLVIGLEFSMRAPPHLEPGHSQWR